MMKWFFITVIVFTTVAAHAQNDTHFVEDLSQDYIAEIKAQGVTDYFVRAQSCEGTVKRFMLRDGSWCTSNGTYINAVVIHFQAGESFLTRIDNCGIFKPVKLNDSSLLNFYTAQQRILKTEVLKKYESDVPYIKTKSRTAVYRCRWDYVFFEGEEEFTSRYNEFQLTNDPEHPNKNFEYNNKHPLVALEAMVDHVLSTLESQGKFIREN